MAVFTISRQAGVVAEDYLKNFAQQHSYTIFSKQVFAEVAKISGQPIDDIKKMYGMDSFSSLKVFIAEMLQSFGTSGVYPLPGIGFDSAVMTPFTYTEITTDVKKELQSYSGALHAVIKKIAEKGSAFIIGRGAHCICADMQGVIHIRLIGDYQASLARIMAEHGCSNSEAEHLYKKIEKNRKEYIEYFFNTDVTDPTCYHIVMNIDRLTSEQADAVLKAFL